VTLCSRASDAKHFSSLELNLSHCLSWNYATLPFSPANPLRQNFITKSAIVFWVPTKLYDSTVYYSLSYYIAPPYLIAFLVWNVRATDVDR
jgi:hypothetical protein